MSKHKWKAINNPIGHGDAYIHATTGLRVIISEEFLADKKYWQHMSVSYPDRLPSWEDLVLAKEQFLGEEVEAYQVLPKRSEYVNNHPYTLHLWRCLDGDLMPS